MPKNKDLKTLARRRMNKTGESYTSARANLVRKKENPLPDVSAVRCAELGGMSDAALRAKTGKTWKQWMRALDALDAASMTHPKIVKLILQEFEVTHWWAQTITVGYERIRGLRDVGQRRDGAYDANKSKTFPVSIAKLYAAFSTARIRKKWLPSTAMKIRAASVEKSMRLDWGDDTAVDLYFTAKGPGKSSVSIQHRKLPSQSDIQSRKDFWADRLKELVAVLEA